MGWDRFTLGDIGTHLTRTRYRRSGLPLCEATARTTSRWDLGVRLIPATDNEVEAHVHVDGSSMHFREWWTRHRAFLAAESFESGNVEHSFFARAVALHYGARSAGE